MREDIDMGNGIMHPDVPNCPMSPHAVAGSQPICSSLIVRFNVLPVKYQLSMVHMSDAFCDRNLNMHLLYF